MLVWMVCTCSSCLATRTEIAYNTTILVLECDKHILNDWQCDFFSLYSFVSFFNELETKILRQQFGKIKCTLHRSRFFLLNRRNVFISCLSLFLSSLRTQVRQARKFQIVGCNGNSETIKRNSVGLFWLKEKSVKIWETCSYTWKSSVTEELRTRHGKLNTSQERYSFF